MTTLLPQHQFRHAQFIPVRTGSLQGCVRCFRATGSALKAPSICSRSRSSRSAMSLRASAGGDAAKGGSVPKVGMSAGQESHDRLATVVENRADSVDGTLRTLVLSIEDHVTFLDGRKMRRRQQGPRWTDSYKLPGQLVGLRCVVQDQEAGGAAGGEGDTVCPNESLPQAVLALASSPYEVRRDSSMLDAAMVEVLVDRSGSETEARLSELGPGALVAVSDVIGGGFGPLFQDSSGAGLQGVLEEGRNMLLIAAGHTGIASSRACIEWTPVQAHATTAAVHLLYAAPSASAAAYIKDWDTWRAASVRVTPCYCDASSLSSTSSNGNGSAAILCLKDALEFALFSEAGALSEAVGGDPREAAVLMSGLPGDVAAWLTKRLTSEGVEGERILYNLR